MLRLTCLLISLSFGLGSVPVFSITPPPRYNVTFIPSTPEMPSLRAVGLNNLGDVVGYSTSTFSPSKLQSGYLYSKGKLTNLRDLTGLAITSAVDINDKGQIVGSYSEGGYIFSLAEGLRSINITGSVPTAINNAGQAAGYIDDPIICLGGSRCAAVFLDNGHFMLLGPTEQISSATRINDQYGPDGIGQVIGTVGSIYGPPTYMIPIGTFLYSEGAFQEGVNSTICPGTGAYANMVNGINNLGQIVGDCINHYGFEQYCYLPFIYNTIDGSTEFIGEELIQPTAINDLGWVVGGGTVGLPFLFFNGHLYNLYDLISYPHKLGGLNPVAINNKGQILANTYLNFNGVAWIAAIILEPICDDNSTCSY